MVNSSYIRLSQWAALHGMHRMTAWRHYNAGTVVKKVDFGRNDLENPTVRRPNSSRRLRPGIAPGNTELVPTQALPQA